MERKALFPGSFDPFTAGHLNILKRALTMFDEVVVAIGVNIDKRGFFPNEKRMDIIRQATAGMEGVSIIQYDNLTIDKCRELGVNTVLSTVWAEGGKGGEDLAREVVRLCEEEKGDFTFSYELEGTIENKIEAIVKKVYGGDGVIFSEEALKQIQTLEELGFSKLPVCIAKTQYSFSDNARRMPFSFRVPDPHAKRFFPARPPAPAASSPLASTFRVPTRQYSSGGRRLSPQAPPASSQRVYERL
mgnify:CR=1 FL=1